MVGSKLMVTYEDAGHPIDWCLTSHIFEKNELTLHSTETGYFNIKALNGISIKWHPISPNEPVPYSHQPLKLNGRSEEL